MHKIHGTKVTVRDLFGKMPVRVKHRAVHYELQENLDKDFEDLKMKIVVLLLAWSRPIKIVLSDTEKKRRSLLRLGQEPLAYGEWDSDTDTKLPFRLDWICPLLAQAGCIAHSSFASWVTASAQTSTTSIRAAISLEPAPTKQLQFFSFGIRPVDPVHGSQVLFDEVNRMFALSSFGAIEDEIEISEDQKPRRQNDKRYKSDGCTTRQLRGIAKRADRWPVFYIRIDSSSEDRMLDEDQGHDSGGKAARILHKVLQLLKTLIYQFLEEHRFQPRARQEKRTGADEMTYMQNSFSDSAIETGSNGVSGQSTSAVTSVVARTAEPRASKLRRHVTGQEFDCRPRVKSGKRDGFEHILSGLPRSKSLQNDSRPATAPAASSHSNNSEGDIGRIALADLQLQPSSGHDVHLLLQDLQNGDLVNDSDDEVLNGVRPSIVSISDSRTTDEEDALRRDSFPLEETVPWTNPATGRVVHINSRTGSIVPDLQKQCDGHESSEEGRSPEPLDEAVLVAGTNPVRSLRSTRKSVESKLHVAPESWDGASLKGSENSIFRRVEEAIPSVVPEEAVPHGEVASCCHTKLDHGSLDQVSALFDITTTVSKGRLSKSGLASAQVLAQIDRKFIFVKISTSLTHAQIDGPNCQSPPEETVLVLIDQHAADERCQVEALYAELCNVETVQLLKPIYFEVSPQEIRLFQLQKDFFAAWGFRYEMETGNVNGAPGFALSRPHKQPTSLRAKGNCEIVVIAVPNLIVERCRLDPKILIDLLRTEVWARAEDGLGKSRVGVSRQESGVRLSGVEASSGDGNQWLTKISSCPKGLIEMLNSRACRSAIMFNDELSIEECKALVKRLAKCSFPFQCAHGRPSMAALGGLGNAGAGEGQSSRLDTVRDNVEGGFDFVKAFDKWQTNAGEEFVGDDCPE